MSDAITVTISDQATEPLRRMGGHAQNPVEGLLLAGRAVESLLKQRFGLNDQKGNKLGGQRTHFWRQIRESTATQTVDRNTVAVVVQDGRFNQKYYGGPITAKRVSNLTIPIHPMAHGRTVRELEQILGSRLFRVNSVLMGRAGNSPKATAYYVLKRQVIQPPDPDALPPMEEIERTVELFNRWMES